MHKKTILEVANSNLLITISVIVSVFVIYLTASNMKNGKQDAIIVANNNAKKITQLIANNIEMSMISVDQTLQRATERQYFNILFGKTLSTDMEHNLSLWINRTPHIESIFLTNENGVVDIFFKKGEEGFKVRPGYKFSFEEHFAKHKNNPDIELLISASGDNDNRRIFISRRMESINGAFSGLAVGVLDGRYLAKTIKSIAGGVGESSISLMLGETQLLSIGKNYNTDSNMDTLFKDEFKKNKDLPVNVYAKYINNQLFIFSSMPLSNMPLSVNMVLPENDIFANWNEKKQSQIFFAVLFIVFITTVIFFLIIIGKKVSQAKESERKALLASQTKSDFLAKMSHELRTPLNAIIGFSDMLSSGYFGKVSKIQVERLKDINMCGSHLLEFITDILDFSKADAGKLSLKESIVDFYDVVNKSVRILDQKAKMGNIEIINQVPRDVNTILGDKRKMKQIMINLLSNAVKFTPQGGSVTISTDRDDNGDFVIKVKDTGVGIAEKDIPRAMAVFEQVNHGEDKGGTGLGLPLCKMFAEMHGGRFYLESKEGEGTTAIVVIPEERLGRAMFEEEMAAI